MITYRMASNLTELYLAHGVLRVLDAFYPDFDDWFINKCMPAILSGRDAMIVAEHRQRIIGVAVVKNDPTEQKLRCVRVAPEYRNRGVAIHLIDQALTALGCDKPATSVPEELLHDWSRVLVNRFGFELGHVAKGIFRPRRLEYFFNGPPAPLTAYGRS